MSEQFAISREDGRSNARVLLDYVKDGVPGRVYTFAELARALGVGTDKTYERSEVRNIVMQSYPQMLKEQQRALYNVRGVGYRLAHAREHNRLALTRKERADVQLKRGLETLQNVRREEMSEAERARHDGNLMVLTALYENQRSMDRRQQRIEAAIAGLTKRMDEMQAHESVLV